MFPILLQQLGSAAARAYRRRPGAPRLARRGRAGKPINLALQGGGAHGAFTWGVLDQVLADGRLTIEGITGASAGAVNAALVADGLARGGPEAAQARLAEFWRAVSVAGRLPDLQRGVVERLFSFAPHGAWLGALSRFWSPYDLNPLNINPLKDLIERFVDFEAIRRDSELALFISATDVRTGELRVFTREEITPEVVIASACLPLVFRAVEIEGIPYWDGGYSGNPAIYPLLRATSTEDVLLVQINPRRRAKAPASTREILSRVSELTFNASLLSELRTVEFVGQLIDQGRLPRGTGHGQFRRLRLHRVAMEKQGDAFDAGSRLKTDFEFFELLHKLGQRATRRFLDAHFDDIGRRGTIATPTEAHAEVARGNVHPRA
jgi:NTE family protein